MQVFVNVIVAIEKIMFTKKQNSSYKITIWVPKWFSSNTTRKSLLFLLKVKRFLVL